MKSSPSTTSADDWTEGARILSFTTGLTDSQLQTFYRAALTRNGWTQIDRARFRHDRMELEATVSATRGDGQRRSAVVLVERPALED